MDERFSRIRDEVRQKGAEGRRAGKELARVHKERRALIRKTIEPRVREIVRGAASGMRWRLDEEWSGESFDISRGYSYSARLSPKGEYIGTRLYVFLSMTEGHKPPELYSITLRAETGEDHNPLKLPDGASATLQELPRRLEEALRAVLKFYGQL